MRKAHQSTVTALRSAKIKCRTLDGICAVFDIDTSKATLGRILSAGPVSLATENRVRAALGLTPCAQEIAPCPTCGDVHVAGDCHGAPVAAVVILRPGERVAPPPQPRRNRPRYYRPCLSRDPVKLVQQLETLLAAARRELDGAKA